MGDPYFVLVETSELGGLVGALDVVDERAELNHRYRKLIADSRQVLEGPRVRLTQARGIAKRLMVLVKAAGPGFADGLGERERAALEEGLAQAESLVQRGPAAGS
ncbi:hypothetical protein A8924_7243 [Saccharopolyspora erythraea NRRL 2338]|uniref:Uncharacterized protein n=2 Tax=Saccharopolyspora erythraea TaxID=1836 RepID=A4FPS0_SACEN|nr:hypothetical protein [Saccharopolyspora erythraea]EQD86929.1 hypothetical protein N599_07055 [Saccharopolyspora erythraea D]PFG99690.1 hypothetical protein A8924_7243 [Saccharopolyspora erythraea NRRL 2338]QRK89575.1 hypothetical protein JQX30_34455 [Saccharopolyspora erythraea]CAM06045.1 hypothetical protein SACE_6881 [Saccharopolyspora erythraea NRRL 2338]